MKKLFAFLLTAILILPAQFAFGSVLVFKLTKQVDSNELTDLATINTAKYSKVRVAVKRLKNTESKEIKSSEINSNETPGLDDFNFILCFAVEGLELFDLGSCRGSTVFDAPPSNISIRVKGAGKYSIAVWGS